MVWIAEEDSSKPAILRILSSQKNTKSTKTPMKKVKADRDKEPDNYKDMANIKAISKSKKEMTILVV